MVAQRRRAAVVRRGAAVLRPADRSRVVQLRGLAEAGALWPVARRHVGIDRVQAGVADGRALRRARRRRVPRAVPDLHDARRVAEARRQGARPAAACPSNFTLQVFTDAWTEGRLGRYLWNSTVVAVIVTVAQVVDVGAVRVRVRVPALPAQGVLVRRCSSRRCSSRWRARSSVNRRTVDSLGWLNTLPGTRGAVPRDRVRHVPAAPGVPPDPEGAPRGGADGRPRSPRVHVGGRAAARAADARRARAVLVPHARGTSTCGRT